MDRSSGRERVGSGLCVVGGRLWVVDFGWLVPWFE